MCNIFSANLNFNVNYYKEINEQLIFCKVLFYCKIIIISYTMK